MFALRTTAITAMIAPPSTIPFSVMQLPLNITDKTLRSGLAVLVVIGQLLGTIGIIPVRANSDESDSTPYPCKGHPCGCRTAALCWSGACCCFTMAEKVAWAAENGLAPPEHATHAAMQEIKHAARKETTQPNSQRSCCSHSAPAHQCDECLEESKSELMPECCANKHQKTIVLPSEKALQSEMSESRTDNMQGPRRNGINWVAGFYAQKCHGDGFGGLGLLNIGIAPTFPQPFIIALPFVSACDFLALIPMPLPSRPLLPPPKC